MKNLSDLLPEVLMSAQSIPAITAEHYLRNAAIKFCNVTRCIRETLDAETVPAGEYEVEIAVFGGEELSAVLNVYVDGNPIDPISEIELRTSGNWKSTTGAPTHYLSNSTTLRLYPIPTASCTVDIEVAKRPSRTSSGVHEELYNEWREVLVAGALSEIMLLPNQPSFDVQMAAYNLQRFNDGLVSAQAKSFKQTNFAPLRVQCS